MKTIKNIIEQALMQYVSGIDIKIEDFTAKVKNNIITLENANECYIKYDIKKATYEYIYADNKDAIYESDDIYIESCRNVYPSTNIKINEHYINTTTEAVTFKKIKALAREVKKYKKALMHTKDLELMRAYRKLHNTNKTRRSELFE